jgi:pimeloyl-ACP methyl ester carboxylesterase
MRRVHRFAPMALLAAVAALLGADGASAQATSAAVRPTPTLAPASGAPSMDAIAILSHGARLNGLIYRAAGEGPHPVAVFFHGFPGNEKNLDLAQAVRRAGWDAVYFDYRGSWGSGGAFSLANSLDDVSAVLAWIRAPANVSKYRLDASRIAIVGHSFGGWLALLGARREPPPVCVAALAAWNVGWTARHLDDSGLRDETVSEFRDATDPAGGPLRTTADALLKELTSAPSAWDYLSDASSLKGRALLLVAATRDTPDEDPAMHARLERAVRDAGGTLVKSVTLEDDHVFSASRLRLAELLVEWLNGDCAASQRGAR